MNGNLGNVTISSNVIKDIIVETLKDVENVIGVYSPENQTSFLQKFKSEEKKKSIEVEMGETECVIDLSISVVYGSNINSVAEKVQKAIKEKVEEFTEISVKEINVTVDKIKKIENKEEKEVVENV